SARQSAVVAETARLRITPTHHAAGVRSMRTPVVVQPALIRSRIARTVAFYCLIDRRLFYLRNCPILDPDARRRLAVIPTFIRRAEGRLRFARAAAAGRQTCAIVTPTYPPAPISRRCATSTPQP